MCRAEAAQYRQAPPDFDYKTLKAAVPARCFERPLTKSFGYLGVDLVIVSLLFFAAGYIPSLPFIARLAAWPAYWFVQGAVMTGVWVIAHECGHGAFSAIPAVNNSVGWVLHSALLVPFFSWKFSHAQHHGGTSDMKRDTVFQPPLRSEVHSNELLQDAPLNALVGCLFMLLVGWPGYLLFGSSGPKYGRMSCHFDPTGPAFKPHQRNAVLLADLGVLTALVAYGSWCYAYGFAHFGCYFFVPYLWTNAWLVTITLLQHTHTAVPHYRGEAWNFVRGALATVDRDFGLLNHVFHHIGDTHVAHHMFSTIPHYHAQEATAALKGVLGESYLYDDTPIWPAVYRCWLDCRFVEDEGDVVYYHSSEDLKRSERKRA